MEYKFKLFKMHCAGCALALEQTINEIAGVKAEISFVTKIIKLKISSDNPAKTLEDVISAIHKFDHSIQISDYEDDEDRAKKERKEKQIKIARYISSIVLMLITLFFKALWLKVSFFAIAYLIVAYEIIYNASKNVVGGRIFDENFLMTIASLGAFVIGEYFEAVCVILLYDIGEMLEDMALSKSRKTIKSLLEIKQPYANLINDDIDEKVPLDSIKVGDLIRVKAGERIPLDGESVSGKSYLDMSALTGETRERIVVEGDEVLSGSINGAGVLVVKVLKLEKDSTVSKIVDMVENATETKAKSEKLISKFSKYYTPTVIALAFLIMIVPPIFLGFNTFSEFAYRALCFLVVSCPCALVISVPLTYFAGIGALARAGILVKGANFLEELAKVNSVVFDKTGTLTEGNFEISEVFAFGEFEKDEIVEVSAYAESFSSHKIAKSVLKYYAENFKKEINSAWINGYEEIAGKGIKANIFLRDTLVGNAKLLKDENISFIEAKKAGTVLYVAIDGQFAGFMVISDKIKKDSENAVKCLKTIGINDISLSTGDEENSAKAICSKLNIKNCYFGLLPEDKVLIITDKEQSGKTVAFVGDGINDAPSLANANVGISMGGFGTDVAVEVSDVVLMTDEPSKVAVAIKKAKKTHKIAIQNIAGSISIKIAILGLISFGLAGMWLAVFADVGVSLLAVLNSLRTMLDKN